MEDNKDFSSYFNPTTDVDCWKGCIENGIADWMKGKKKQSWEVVRYVSNYLGLTKNLGRQKFAELLVNLCPGALADKDTPDSLKYNMDKSEYYKQLEYKHILSATDPLMIAVNELTDIFRTQPKVTSKETPSVFGILRKNLESFYVSYPFKRIRERPFYNGFRSDFSVEVYMTKQFYDEGKPTSVYLYKIEDGIVDAEVVLKNAARYMNQREVKLFIVSEYGFDNNTKKIAEERNVGLMRIASNEPQKEPVFYLPRFSDRRFYALPTDQVLAGNSYRNYPVRQSIFDHQGYIDWETLINSPVPLLKREEIETIAFNLIKEEAEHYQKTLSVIDYLSNDIPSFTIDPFRLAKKNGLTVIMSGELPKSTLGILNIEEKKMFINVRIENTKRIRFSGAHEDGHYILHSRNGQPIFKETTETIMLTEPEVKRMEFQANVFASSLLMPANVVNEYYRIYWQKHNGDRQPEPLEVWNRNEFLPNFHRIVCPIARKMDVSTEAMKWRLFHMGLLKCSKANYLNTIR